MSWLFLILASLLFGAFLSETYTIHSMCFLEIASFFFYPKLYKRPPLPPVYTEKIYKNKQMIKGIRIANKKNSCVNIIAGKKFQDIWMSFVKDLKLSKLQSQGSLAYLYILRNLCFVLALVWISVCCGITIDYVFFKYWS